MFQRKSNVFIFYFLANLLLFCLMFAHVAWTQKSRARDLNEKRELVGRLELTDLCLFTDARYTRHPSMADRNTPFQDYPMSLEHFPSGSVLPLPPHLKPHKPN
jgi:hypothetical protein